MRGHLVLLGVQLCLRLQPVGSKFICIGDSDTPGGAFQTSCAGGASVCLSSAGFLQGCETQAPATIQNALTGSCGNPAGRCIDSSGDNPSDTVLVFPGTYTGGIADQSGWWSGSIDHGNQAQPNTVESAARNIRLSFSGKSVKLVSTGGPSVTKISCEGKLDTFGIVLANGEQMESLIEGFTIYKCGRTLFQSPPAGELSSGGLRVMGDAHANAGLRLRYVVFHQNSGLNGGAISIASAAVSMSRVLLQGNQAGQNGGAIYVEAAPAKSSQLWFYDCLLTNNTAAAAGGAIYIQLDQFVNNGVYLNSTVIFSNVAGTQGGGIYDSGGGDIDFSNSIITSNTATNAPASAQMYCGTSTSFTNADPTFSCSGGQGRQEPVTLSSYVTELSVGDKVVIGTDRQRTSFNLRSPSQPELPFYYGTPGQIWYLAPPSSYRSPVSLSVSGMTLRPFRDMVEVLVIPKSQTSLADMFSGECFTRDDGGDYRGVKSVSRENIACVRWDAHAPYEHHGRNTPSTNAAAGFEDGAVCRNPCPGEYCRGAPWCYLAEQTATGKWFDACTVGTPVDACARNLVTVAQFSSNSTWPVFTDSDKGMYIKLHLDEDYMTEGGLTLELRYAESCKTAGCGGHGLCTQHQAALNDQNFSPSCLSQAGALVSETNEANCETLNGNPNATTGNTWGLYTCVCNSGWGGVDCTVQLIQATRIKLVTFTGGFTLLETQEEHVNLQVALSSSVKDDVVKVGSDTFSGYGNYDLVMGNVNMTFRGAGPLYTTVDCLGLGRGLYIDSSSAAYSTVAVTVEDMAIVHCHANDVPSRGPRGGAIYVKEARLTLRNLIIAHNRADDRGAGIYVWQSTVTLEDTVIGPNNTAANTGGGVGMEQSVLIVDRAFVSENIGVSAADVQLANFACYTDSRVDYVKGFHWEKLGSIQVELDICSCCNGCIQNAPSIEVTQVTVDYEQSTNMTLGIVPTKLVIQGKFVAFGDDSRVTRVYVAGQACVMRNVTSSLIICGISSPYHAGQSIQVMRSDGESAKFPPVNGSDTFPVYIGRGVQIDVINNISTENGIRAVLNVKLRSEPQSSVVIPFDITVDNDTAILPHLRPFKAALPCSAPGCMPFKLTFTGADWNVPQRVELTGQDDLIISGAARLYDVLIGPTRSLDTNYKDRDQTQIGAMNTEYSCNAGYTPMQDITPDGRVFTRCVCSPGYSNDVNDPDCQGKEISSCKCERCGNGKYKRLAGDAPCTLCPQTQIGEANFRKMDTNGTLGNTDVSGCMCMPKYVLNTNTTAPAAYDPSSEAMRSNLTCISCMDLCFDKLGAPDTKIDLKDESTWCAICTDPGQILHEVAIPAGFWRSQVNSSYVYKCPGGSRREGTETLCLNTSGTVNQNQSKTLMAAKQCRYALDPDNQCEKDMMATGCSGNPVSIGGGEYDSRTVRNQCNLPCERGSLGVMCTACDVMWAKDYTSKGGCSSCSKGGQMFLMVLVVLLFASVLGYGVWSSIKSAEDEDRTSTMLFKILISFTLTNVEVMKYRSEWPNLLKDIFETQQQVNAKTSVNFNDFVSFDCLFAGSNSIDRVYNKTFFYMVLPISSIMIPAIPLGVKGLYHRIQMRSMHPSSDGYNKATDAISWCKEVYAASVVVILYQMYPTSVNYAASLFKLTPLQFDGEEHLDIEPSIVGSDSEYQYWSTVAGIVGLGGYAAGIPAFFAVLLWTVRHEMDTLSTSRKYGFLYGGFSKNRIWWEAVVMIRKLLFLLSATFLSRETVAFRVGIAMVITVTFLVLQLMLLPYPEEFMMVGLMEVISMLTVFFTYGAVLLMDPAVTGTPENEGWSDRDNLFLGLILFWNMLFMILIVIMIARDIWRHTADHIAEHGVKESLKHLKSAVKEKAKVDKIRERIQSFKSPKGGPPDKIAVAPGSLAVGSMADLLARKAKQQKKESVKLMWLRGLSGASSVASATRKMAMLKSMDEAIQQDDVDKARLRITKSNKIHAMGGSNATPEEVIQLKLEVADLRERLKKENKSNVSNRLRLGLEKKRVIDLKMAGMGGDGGSESSVGGGRGDIDIEQIDEVLQLEAGNKAVQLHNDLKDAHAVKGADGKLSKVDQKWQAEDAQSTLQQGKAGGEEISPAEPPPPMGEKAGPSPRRRQEGPRDASKTVGNAIFYGNTRDREGAGRNAKAFLGAAQRVKKNVHVTSQLKAAMARKVSNDRDWFNSHSDLTEHDFTQQLVPQPPPGDRNPSGRTGFATSRGLLDSIGGQAPIPDKGAFIARKRENFEAANPGQTPDTEAFAAAAEEEFRVAVARVESANDALVHGSRSNAELLMLRAGQHSGLDKPGKGQPAASIPGTLRVDLQQLERGLGLPPGEIVPLSDEHIQGQIDEWKQINLNAEVHAMRTKMTMLSRFSARSLSQSVSPQRQRSPDLSGQMPTNVPEEGSEQIATV